jgi:hypothetical protein
MANPEVHRGGVEHTGEIEKAAAERAAELREKGQEQGERPEHNAEKLAADARAEAEKQAAPAEDYRPAAEKETHAPHHTAMAHSPEKSYKHTMQTIQREMSAPERTFSKVIHNKAVEKVSDVAGNTVARPNALLSGAVCAFLVVGALYLHARHLGYELRGSETILAFLLGWGLGIAFDFLRAMVTGKR